MESTARGLVRARAEDRCEYCRLPQAAVDATFHVDHVVAQQHLDQVENEPEALALACDRCNLHKGTNLSSIDPVTEEIVLLFNPRRDQWEDNFALEGGMVVGLTPRGRATARLLQMNAKHRVQLRYWLAQEGLL